MRFSLSRLPDSNTHFAPIKIGGMFVSVQASEHHYCSPRKTFASSDDYEEFEVAITVGDEWFHPERDERFSGKSWASYWSTYDDVAANVPREEVIKMLAEIKEITNAR